MMDAGSVAGSSAPGPSSAGSVQGSIQKDPPLQEQAEAFRALLRDPGLADGSEGTASFNADPGGMLEPLGGSAEKLARFSSLVKGAPLTARELAHWAAELSAAEALARAAREDPELGQGAGDYAVGSEALLQKDSPAGGNADALAALQWAAAQAPTSPSAMAAVATEGPDLTLAELIEKHIRRTLVTSASDGSSSEEVRLELSDAVLPGTALTLRRAPGGWQLLASTDNREALERLSQHSPALVERFARASLGSLEVLAQGGVSGESNAG